MGRNKTSNKLSDDRIRVGLPLESNVGFDQEDLDRGQESQGGMVRDRFDLEQEILECWKVCDDIKMYIEQGAQAEDFSLLAKYYERKFDRLWDTFELLLKQHDLR